MSVILDEVKRDIREELPDNSYSLWIEPIILLDHRDDTFVLGCPNKFSMNWISEHYLDILEKKFNHVGEGGCTLTLRVRSPEKRKPAPDTDNNPKQLFLPHIPVNGLNGRKKFNSEFTFDRFIVGKCNEFAYQASRDLALGGERSHHSLFILADTGLGKSHLSQAIGNAILDHDSNKRVYYITAEDFINEMIASLKNNRIEAFKNKYRRSCDVLLLEEVHFLAGKSKTQLELGHTLDALANDNKKIIFTSALLPKDLPKMAKDLSSRLTSGIIAGLESPDFSTREKILKQKSLDQGLVLSGEVTGFLAERLTHNVRQLESALKCIKAKSELMKARINLNLAKEVVSSYTSERRCTTIEDILRLVCQYYKVDSLALQSKSRKKIHAYPRNIYIYLCRNHTDATMETIGRSINRKHSTVVYASEVVEKKMKQDRRMKKELGFLTQKLEEIPK